MSEQKNTNETVPQPSAEDLREISDSVEGGRFIVNGSLVNAEGEPLKETRTQTVTETVTEETKETPRKR